MRLNYFNNLFNHLKYYLLSCIQLHWHRKIPNIGSGLISGGLFWWEYIRVGLHILLELKKAIFLVSERLIFKISKLINLLVPLHNWMTRFEAGVTGSPRDAPEGKWTLGGGIEIPCTYKMYGRMDQKTYMCK